MAKKLGSAAVADSPTAAARNRPESKPKGEERDVSAEGEQTAGAAGAPDTAGLLDDAGSRRLFDDDGKPTELTNRALEFCRAFHGNHLATQEFVTALTEHALLTDNATEIRLPDDRQIKMQGYKIVDREKFDALSDEVFLDWRRRGWLPVVYSHLIALSNWPQVLQRAAVRGGAGAAGGE